MSDVTKKVDQYINKHSHWKDELTELRSIFLKTNLKEEVKWGAPAYTLDGSLVAGIGAFKNHYAIWFHQGVFLKDPNKKLINAQEGVTKALRQWKFKKNDPVEPNIIINYLEEASENARLGRKLIPKRKKELVIPSILKQALDKDSSFNDAFNKLTPGKQREYADHIGGAKREATQAGRLEKSIPMIFEGKGLYDKYKNC
jgi:uncharacterized protein YdeI (YjbR/CyaY-like superfamily)